MSTIGRAETARPGAIIQGWDRAAVAETVPKWDHEPLDFGTRGSDIPRIHLGEGRRMAAVLSAIDNFPLSLTVLVLALAAMLIFREPIAKFLGRILEMKAGPVSVKAQAPCPDPAIIKQIEEIAARQAVADEKHLDVQRLVIRDSAGRPRILASTLPSGEPFLALFDEAGRPRASLTASSATDPDEIAILVFHGQTAGETASFIGAERDGSGAVGFRDSSGSLRVMS